MVTDSENYSGFPQINQRPLVIMMAPASLVKKNTVSLT